MKTTHLSLLKSTLILAILSIFCCFDASAARATYITQDGIRYAVDKTKGLAYVASPATGTTYPAEITIPDKFTNASINYTVKGIYASAFLNDSALTKITLPETCVEIGAFAFKNCVKLATFPIGEQVTSIGQSAFEGCTSLTEAFIPAGVTGNLVNQQFAGCTSLQKFVIKDATTSININTDCFVSPALGETPAISSTIGELYYGRNIGPLYVSPFRNNKSVTKVTIGPNVTSLQSREFMGCTELISADLSAVTAPLSLVGETFSGCSKLTAITMSNMVSSIPSSFCKDCSSLTTVTLPSTITSIGDLAFSNTKLAQLTLPEGLTFIGIKAFENAIKGTTISIPNSCTTVKDKAFFGSNLNTISLPATTNLGIAVFASCPLNNIEVRTAEGTPLLTTDGFQLTSVDGKTLKASVTVDASKTELVNNTIETIEDYGFSNAPYKKVTLPALKNVGYRAFYNMANLESWTITVAHDNGTNILEKTGITELNIEEGLKVLPAATCKDCANLNKVNLPVSLNVIMNDAFAGCSKLKEMELGTMLNYLEAGAIPASVETITCKNVNVPIVNENLFSVEQNNVTCKVAESAIADFKANQYWNRLNIVGDATITGAKVPVGCPTGLYFATTDGKLMYQTPEGVISDTNIPAGPHAFQLGAGHNRVYVSYAGKYFTYQNDQATTGDGELFYLNKAGDSFYRVTLVSNIGYQAFQDPFSLSVDAPNHLLYVADRNVGVHKIDTERPGLYGTQPFLVENAGLGYYGAPWSYGAIGCGLERDSQGTYWMGKKFNGYGIFRFTDADIEAGASKLPDFPILFNNTTLSTFTIDEANDFLYAYLMSDGVNTPGVYRFKLSDLKTKGSSATFADGTLIDASPVLEEGTAPSELTGVTQISSNGTNVYWAYIAPTSEDDKYIGKGETYATAFDATNPLHKNGIKYIKADGSSTEVKYAVPDVKAYGVAAYVFDASGVDVVNNKVANKAIVRGAIIDVPDDANISIIALNGATLAQRHVAAGASVSLEGYASGLYLVKIIYADGAQQVVKVIR